MKRHNDKCANKLEEVLSRYRVDTETGCWIWLGNYRSNGYGRVRIRGETWSAHRLFYIHMKGEIRDELHVCHKCDNRACVNPDHLFLGDDKANALDKVSKHRQSRGSQIRGKLTDNDVAAIRLSDLPVKELASLLNVHQGTIYKIRSFKFWRHVELAK